MTTGLPSCKYQLKGMYARQYLLSGQVQGVGFRPFVYRLAQELGIQGWVENRMGQVAIHAEADLGRLDVFEQHLREHCPPHACPVFASMQDIERQDCTGFEIRSSNKGQCPDIYILTDLPVCQPCLNEMADPDNRRYHYPFINCTDCGPRYSIIQQLPYDRVNTSMSGFELCPACLSEYKTASDRRFHAEPIACPDCGPGLLFEHGSTRVRNTEAALKTAIKTWRDGGIIAVKGVGGYHLMCDASNDETIMRLRKLKPRPDKPLAVMMLQSHLDRNVRASAAERQFLAGDIHPIVLLEHHPDNELSAQISPALQKTGVMLPYSPLHHLLLQEFNGPLAASSANVGGEPVITNAEEIKRRLSPVTDGCLHHNRPIERPCDDPVYQFIANRPRPVRLGRGSAPLELSLPFTLSEPVLAVGGHMKNTIALAWDDRIVISPHIGDLETLRSQQVFEQVITDLQKLYRVEPAHVICDCHPGYGSHRWAAKQERPLITVYHHHAHAACLAGEYPHESRWLVFTWDGLGLGPDQTLWGGEAMLGRSGHWQQAASMRPFFLPGGEKAGRQPWRSAAALCWETGHSCRFQSGQPPRYQELLHSAWQKRINSPQTSSVGRLFDAAAALTGLVQTCSYEGQAPMWLEAKAVAGNATAIDLPLEQDEAGIWRSDWSPLLPMLACQQRSQSDRARCFHESLAQTLLQQALTLRATRGDFAVGLGGGVFQNRLLTERVLDLLEQHRFRCYLPEQIPVNDAGLCYGQVIEYAGKQCQEAP